MNANLLKAKFKEIGKTQGEIAKEAGMSENSLSRKLSGKREFKLSEIIKLCELLNIQNPCEIFLNKVS